MNEKLKKVLLGSGIVVGASSGLAVQENEPPPTREELREMRQKMRETRSFFRELREFLRSSPSGSHVSNCNSSCSQNSVKDEKDEDVDNKPFDVESMENSACRSGTNSKNSH